MRVMDPEEDPVGPDPLPDFAFAFDDSNFSDSVLRIEIISDSPDSSNLGAADHPSSSSSSTATSLADWARNRKRPRDPAPEVIRECKEEEQVLNCNLLDTDDDAVIVAGYDNPDDEADVMVEEPRVSAASMANAGHDGDDVDASGSGSTWKEDFPGVLRVRNIHISSPILAVRSPFFYSLFSMGMKESKQRNVTVRIHASKEAAFLDLLNFMYSNTLSTNTPVALLDVLMAADKFEVASCMRECSRLLQNLPMTCESALVYLDLPSSVMMAEAVQPLTDAAKQFLAAHYKDITKFPEELLNLPLAGFEAVMSSDHLQVASEDAVYDIVLKWAHTHYPRLEGRREILASRLGRLIRFPFMTCRRLKKVLTCNDFDPELASKVVLEALFYKGETPHKQRHFPEEEADATCHRFVERAYRYRPVKVVEFELPCQQCIVYLDLNREECSNLFPTGWVYSQAFHLGGQGFFLSAHCNMDQQSSFHCFGLFLGMQEKGSVSFAVDYEFAARQKPTDEFVSKYRGNYTFTAGKAVGYRNLFGLPWTAFIADDSIYFINGILHLRAELTVRQ